MCQEEKSYFALALSKTLNHLKIYPTHEGYPIKMETRTL